VRVRRLVGDDWRLLREVRLAALLDAPAAFGSSYQQEAGFDEARWRDRIAGAAVFAGYRDGEPTGLVGCFVEDDGLGHLVMMWVRADARGTGLAGALVAAVLAWARAQGLPGVRLWVTTGNDAARRLYVGHGFVPTGASCPLPSDPTLTEHELVLRLA